MKAALLTVVALLCLVSSSRGLDNGLARLPIMGWNTWCTDDYCGLFDFCYEAEIKEMADAMVSSGMKDLGYQYINLDDCWGGPRDANGSLTAETSRFPSGSLKDIADYVHSKGLKLGVYICAGNTTCKYGRPGSWGHFDQDAQTLADWGADLVKMDWCSHPALPPATVYGMMRDSLNKTGRPMVFSACEWGEDQPWTWGKQTANMWRVHTDHLPLWYSDQGTANIIQSMAGLSKYAGPGGWNDPDFLMTGLFPFTWLESRTEFSLWALWAAPLIVATDIRNMTQEKKDILLNADIIAVNQDPLAIAGDLAVNNTDGTQVWIKPLGPFLGGSFAVVFYNSDNVLSHNITVQWSVFNWDDGAQADARDLWAHKVIGFFKANYTAAAVPPHGAAMLKFTLLQ